MGMGEWISLGICGRGERRGCGLVLCFFCHLIILPYLLGRVGGLDGMDGIGSIGLNE